MCVCVFGPSLCTAAYLKHDTCMFSAIAMLPVFQMLAVLEECG